MASELTDAFRCFTIGAIGYGVTFATGIEEWARLIIAVSTAVYMAGKALGVWRSIWLKKDAEDETD